MIQEWMQYVYKDFFYKRYIHWIDILDDICGDYPYVIRKELYIGRKFHEKNSKKGTKETS
jgi:hypothetical protein